MASSLLLSASQELCLQEISGKQLPAAVRRFWEKKNFDSWLFAINERLFEFIFILARLVFGCAFIYELFMTNRSVPKDIPIPLLLCFIFIHLFTLLFVPIIIRDFYRRDILGKKRQKTE